MPWGTGSPGRGVKWGTFPGEVPWTRGGGKPGAALYKLGEVLNKKTSKAIRAFGRGVGMPYKRAKRLFLELDKPEQDKIIETWRLSLGR